MDMKKITVLLMCALMMIPITYADRNITENQFEGLIQPKFVSIAEFRNDFSIDASGKAGMFSILDAYDGSKVVISAYLQRYQNGQWTNIKHWSVEEQGTYAEMDVSWYIASGYMYRMTSYGYGNLIVSGDTHSSVYTELYDDMHTLANATDPNWYDDGLNAYFDRHNYNLPFTSDFNPTISEFTTIKNQIDDDNPGTILFNSSSSYGAHYTTLVGYAVDEAVDEQYYIIHDLWWDTSENIYRNWDNDVYYDDVVWGYYLFDIN